jgi:hydrogenase maturation protease
MQPNLSPIAGTQRFRSAGSRARFLVAGLGNLLLTDDGVGIHAIHELERDPVPGVTIAEIGTAILHGLPFVEAARRVLVIDAARGGRPPGTIYVFDSSDPASPGPMHSLHSMGLREALRVLSPGCEPPAITVIGVEPASLEYGMTLSPPVRAALPQVVALARHAILEWLRTDQCSPTTATASSLFPCFT